ncbi:DUF805 domain-containing protein [Vibrio kagoshimensis]|uniref:DUF805 domain-containing protein n=1 Tax=Vibrio kagoshimensis TaxID=2910244 RepID=UPI003D24B888
MEYFISTIKQYAVFKGRARRKEFWYFYLISLVISFALAFLDNQMGTFNPELGGGLLGGVYGIFIFLPSLSLTVRRIHDTSHSGYWAFILLIPIIGVLAILFFALMDSKPGSNEYGISPKEPAP